MVNEKNISVESIWKLLENVYDPEVPVLSVVDLGIVRDIKMIHDEVEVFITPTYSGCPAMHAIPVSIKMMLMENGYKNVQIKNVLSPAWTTDWMTDSGKQKLKAFGIAPPTVKQQVCHLELFHDGEAIQCPKCNSYNTRVISHFGSTACKALYQCNDCHEPFDYFKCH